MSMLLFLPAGKPRSATTSRQAPDASCASSASPLGFAARPCATARLMLLSVGYTHPSATSTRAGAGPDAGQLDSTACGAAMP
jgi:hypothetical protein